MANLSAPWISYLHKIEAMFKDDPDIKLFYDDGKKEIKLYVTGKDKADALSKLLPTEKVFGTTALKVTVIPANKDMEFADLFRNAFEGNPYYEDTTVIQPVGSLKPCTFVTFKKKVMQFWDDNLGDPHGNVSTLAQEVAKEIFKDIPGIFFCTDNE